MFSQGKPGKRSDSIETFVNRMVDVHPDVRSRVLGRLKQLELATVADLSTKTKQFFQRELVPSVDTGVVEHTLVAYYGINLKDLKTVQRAPGDPPRIDSNYGGAPRFE
ncbi:MAG: hypothetical protein HYT16_00965 [DPANN group archaeon]|nr:hypothetical protein [DPANN group archaeon]